MKKLFALVAFLASLSSFAQPLPQNQCPVAGVLLSREYVGLAGETTRQVYDRQGTHEIPTEAQFAGFLKARTFKVFHERFCVAKVYSYQQQVCADVHPDLAIGRGNDLYRSMFDLNITLLKRAEIFSRYVKYGVNAPHANRLTTATEVVKHMTRLASMAGMPKSWEGFSQMLKQIVSEGFMIQAEFDEIAITHSAINRRNLGFEPLPGVRFNEGKGNGKLARLFDLTLSLQHRAALIKNTLQGVTAPASQALAKSFIDFASVNGVPANWNQLVFMLKDSVAKAAISEAEFKNITENLETQNRANLGFEINYFVCKMENRQHHFNAIEEDRKNEFNDERSANFRLFVTKAPLLRNEEERIEVQFHSLDGLKVVPSQSYNNFTVETAVEGDVKIFSLTGARKLVTPPNNINAQLLHQGNKLNINLQNTEFNPLVGGKVVVEVHFYEKVVILKDKYLGMKTFELTDGNMTAFTPEVKMIKGSRPAYVQVYMKVVGSPYYNENKSHFKEFKD